MGAIYNGGALVNVMRHSSGVWVSEPFAGSAAVPWQLSWRGSTQPVFMGAGFSWDPAASGLGLQVRMTGAVYSEDPSATAWLYAHVWWFHSGGFTSGYYNGGAVVGTTAVYFDTGWFGVGNPGGYFTASLGFGGASTNNAWSHGCGALAGRWVG
jgi:hypothetical protein